MQFLYYVQSSLDVELLSGPSLHTRGRPGGLLQISVVCSTGIEWTQQPMPAESFFKQSPEKWRRPPGRPRSTWIRSTSDDL